MNRAEYNTAELPIKAILTFHSCISGIVVKYETLDIRLYDGVEAP